MSNDRPQRGVTPAEALPLESQWGGLAIEALAAAAADIEELDATGATRAAESGNGLEAALYDVGSELARIGQQLVQAQVCALQDIACELRALRTLGELEREEAGR